MKIISILFSLLSLNLAYAQVTTLFEIVKGSEKFEKSSTLLECQFAKDFTTYKEIELNHFASFLADYEVVITDGNKQTNWFNFSKEDNSTSEFIDSSNILFETENFIYENIFQNFKLNFYEFNMLKIIKLSNSYNFEMYEKVADKKNKFVGYCSFKASLRKI